MMLDPADRPLVFLDVDGPRRPPSGQSFGNRVDPSIGLTDADFASIHRWLADQ